MNHPGRPDASKVNPFNENARRHYILAYFQADGLFSAKLHGEPYQKAVDIIANKVNDQGDVKVGHLFFEYMVDATIWKHTFLQAEATGMAPAWPWPQQKPVAHDMSKGISVTYWNWRFTNGLPNEPLSDDEIIGLRARAVKLSQDRLDFTAQIKASEAERKASEAKRKALETFMVSISKESPWRRFELIEAKIRELESQSKNG
ncbi:hypothetical protein BKA59DRAFT_449132 [Fusarium tricinctum]|uniref:Uncharacterized protein n=1 Tax=Fusarium tricinctum TaxID=61284 RepID=A0A8K0SA10_9HYPO|nr:hypothetical protein BKA59DRAFT_449132 [Fusarium tricinctum]